MIHPFQLGWPWAHKIWMGKVDSQLSRMPTWSYLRQRIDDPDDRDWEEEELPSLLSGAEGLKHFEHLGPVGSSVSKA